MHISFENEFGKITIGGGSHRHWNATKITGIGTVSKTFKTTVYAGRDGRRTLSEAADFRTITIGGDVCGKNVRYEVTKAAKILNHKGFLTIVSGGKRRKIECRCVNFDIDEKMGANQIFVMQFACDNPYFTDFHPIKAPIFKSEGMIKERFHFPMALTVRTNETYIKNSGDTDAQPKITLFDSGKLPPLEDDVISIFNLSNSTHLKLNYSTSGGEVVEIDIPSRKIVSNINGNIINCITHDTFLNDFKLKIGTNHILVSSNKSIYAEIEFMNQYIEAVH